MDEREDLLKSLCQYLNDHSVNYLIIGGTAINYYGHTRPSTNLPAGIEFDIDI